MREVEIKCPKCSCREKKITQICCSSSDKWSYHIFKCDDYEDILTPFKLEYESIWINKVK